MMPKLALAASAPFLALAVSCGDASPNYAVMTARVSQQEAEDMGAPKTEWNAYVTGSNHSLEHMQHPFFAPDNRVVCSDKPLNIRYDAHAQPHPEHGSQSMVDGKYCVSVYINYDMVRDGVLITSSGNIAATEISLSHR